MKAPDKEAFTLLELLVVLAIVAVLAALIAGVWSRVQESVRQVKCLSHLTQLAAAVPLYASDHEGRFPVFKDFDVALVPYVRDQRFFYCTSADEFNRGKSRSDGLRNDYFLSAVVNDFVWDADGHVHAEGKLALTLPNPSLTVMCGDATGSLRDVKAANGMPITINGMPGKGIVRHFAGANFVFMDGHAKLLNPEEQYAQDEARERAGQ